MKSWSLAELLPHRPPMVLIDEVVSFEPDQRRLTACVTITDRQLFFVAGGVPNWVAIEYMAQTAAALVGYCDKLLAADAPSRPGLLLGTRKLELNLDRFEAGRTYRIIAENAFNDSDAASFVCSITDDKGATVATAILNAYCPPDMELFLKEQAAR